MYHINHAKLMPIRLQSTQIVTFITWNTLYNNCPSHNQHNNRNNHDKDHNNHNTTPILCMGMSKGSLYLYDARSNMTTSILGKHGMDRITCGLTVNISSEESLLLLGGQDRTLSVSNVHGDTLCSLLVAAEVNSMVAPILVEADDEKKRVVATVDLGNKAIMVLLYQEDALRKQTVFSHEDVKAKSLKKQMQSTSNKKGSDFSSTIIAPTDTALATNGDIVAHVYLDAPLHLLLVLHQRGLLVVYALNLHGRDGKNVSAKVLQEQKVFQKSFECMSAMMVKDAAAAMVACSGR